MKKLSVSQLKTFNWDKARRAGEHLLWIKDFDWSPAMTAGNIYEEILCRSSIKKQDIMTTYEEVKQSEYAISQKHCYRDKEWNMLSDVYDETRTLVHNLCKNSEDLHIDVQETQKYVECELLWYDFCWYIDVYNTDCIIDIKTISKAKNLDTVSQYSKLSHNDEYELQLWFYMYATWTEFAKIVEVNWFQYQRPPKEWTRKIIEYVRTPEMDNKRLTWIWQRLKEMQYIYDNHRFNPN